MADGNQNSATPQPTFRGTIMTLNPKIVLAFFLVIVAAALTVFLTVVLMHVTVDGKATLDPGTIALLAGFVTTFILMAKSAADYQFTSSAGSDKKDDAQTAVSKALADKVAPPPGAPSPNTPVPPWWGRLTDAEKNAITAAGSTDPRVAAFVTASQNGAATPDDLAYMVSKSLLTQERADLIKAT